MIEAYGIRTILGPLRTVGSRSEGIKEQTSCNVETVANRGCKHVVASDEHEFGGNALKWVVCG